ncbi:uncharacterized protein [Aegilops tauschii subsp. strangulata]|uniref:uncharacterized protein n=1 Tax=Aegilops tauschii subsp. strangulata TaxID=200361 RepID=UPI003CC8736A
MSFISSLVDKKIVTSYSSDSGGSWFLFNRKVHRLFRNDGYQWQKKTTEKSNYEAHEYLKVDNVKALNCYYARVEENPTFMKRIYWMLEPAYDHIVLVHYRDVLEGTLTAETDVQQFAVIHGDHETDMQVQNSDCCSETNVQQFAVMHGDHETDMQIEPTPDYMPLQHLKDITNNFCNERILGRGGFGVVYKVSLMHICLCFLKALHNQALEMVLNMLWRRFSILPHGCLRGRPLGYPARQWWLGRPCHPL